jgi:dCTP deaminase
MILPYQHLISAVDGKKPIILAEPKILKKQIQAATIDCRLGERIFRISTSMIPQSNEKVSELIKKYCIYDFKIKEGSVLEPNACYLVPLREELKLPKEFFAVFSPKSSSGRVDTFIRVLSDNFSRYDIVSYGYQGKLYLEIIPLSFLVGIAPDVELVQLRIKSKDSFLSNEELRLAHVKHGLVYSDNGELLDADEIVLQNGSIQFSIDLSGREIVGFKAKRNPTDKIDLFRKNYYEAENFWIPIQRPKNRELVLTPGDFYLLTTKEKVKIPPEYAAEIMVYDVTAGELRTHYAGFFDPGFGGEFGTNIVLEVRARDVPFRLFDGQPICRMVFEKMLETPEKIYGKGFGSHYTGSGPSLSKHFKKAW